MPTSEGHMLGTSTRGEEHAPGFRIRPGPGTAAVYFRSMPIPVSPRTEPCTGLWLRQVLRRRTVNSEPWAGSPQN